MFADSLTGYVRLCNQGHPTSGAPAEHLCDALFWFSVGDSDWGWPIEERVWLTEVCTWPMEVTGWPIVVELATFCQLCTRFDATRLSARTGSLCSLLRAGSDRTHQLKMKKFRSRVEPLCSRVLRIAIQMDQTRIKIEVDTMPLALCSS